MLKSTKVTKTYFTYASYTTLWNTHQLHEKCVCFQFNSIFLFVNFLKFVGYHILALNEWHFDSFNSLQHEIRSKNGSCMIQNSINLVVLQNEKVEAFQKCNLKTNWSKKGSSYKIRFFYKRSFQKFKKALSYTGLSIDDKFVKDYHHPEK